MVLYRVLKRQVRREILTKQETSGNLPGEKNYKKETKMSLNSYFPGVVLLFWYCPCICIFHFFTNLFTSFARFRCAQCVPHEPFLLTFYFFIRVRSLVIFLIHSNLLLMQNVFPSDLAEIQKRTAPSSLTSRSHHQKPNLFLMSFRNILDLI